MGNEGKDNYFTKSSERKILALNIVVFKDERASQQWEHLAHDKCTKNLKMFKDLNYNVDLAV